MNVDVKVMCLFLIIKYFVHNLILYLFFKVKSVPKIREAMCLAVLVTLNLYTAKRASATELHLLWNLQTVRFELHKLNAMQSVESQPTFQRNMTAPSSGSKSKSSKKPMCSR
jgi:hypothetical protein